MTIDASEIVREPTPMPVRVRQATLALTALGAILVIPAAIVDVHRFLTDWLAMFVILLTVGLGALFLVALEFVVNARWSVPLRRISEHMAALVPVSLILAIPVVLGLGTLYQWTHADVVALDDILRAKRAYLNVPFFMARFVVYFAVWIAAYWFFVGGSLRQDRNGDVALTRRAMRVAPAYMVAYAFTITFAAVDWIMSLMPHWYSTIFGAYVGMSAVVAGFAVTTLIAAQLRLSGLLPRSIRSDHFYNLGAMLFAMNVFWAYLAFAQYMLIWFGHLPAETSWFVPRGRGGWLWISLFQLAGHFGVPFFALLSRAAKTNLRRLRWVSIWLLAAHALDMYWLIGPSVRTSRSAFSWNELGFLFLTVGIGMLVWVWRSSRAPLMPVRDPRLEAGLAFRL